jgi:hypothetical protein
MGVGFLVSWLVPVAGVLLMVIGALATAIASESALIPAERVPSTQTGDAPANALQPGI